MANQKSTLVENQDYCVRSGTNNHGQVYEIKIATLLLLRCSRQNVEDMKLMRNIEGCGAFDDIVVFVKLKNMDYAVYFIQLKHQEKAKDISPQELRNRKSAFGLPKYFDDFCAIQNFRNEALPSQSAVTYLLREINQNLDLWYIIFTNRGAQPCDLLKEMVVDSNFDTLINTNGSVFQFDPDKLKLVLRRNDTEEFSNTCFLFSNQISVGDALNEQIEKEIKNLLQPMVLTSDILCYLRKKYMSVITKWSKGDLGGFYHLTKSRVLEILAEFVFNKYMAIPNKNEENCENFQMNIWDDIIQKYKLTVVELDNTVDRFLQVHIQNTINAFRKNSENQILWKESRDALNRLMLRNISSNLSEACDNDIYEYLWKRRKLPVLLKTGEHLSFKHILNIYEAFKDMFHIIVMHRGETESPVKEVLTKSFSTLDDLNEELKQNVLESSVALQHGRPHIKLKYCLNSNFFKFVTVRDIVHILSGKYCIGDKLNNLPEFFVPRSINHICLEPQVLVAESKEIFAINCSVKNFRTFLDNRKMTPYIHDSQICSVSNIDPSKLSNSRFLIVEDSAVFDKMFDSNFSVPVHFLLLHDLKIIQWLKTNGTVQNINRFVLNQNSIASNTILTNTFSRKILIPNLISASPGMGKSILMDYIALNSPKYMWILRVNLSEHIDYYESNHFETTHEEPFKYLLELNKRILEKQSRNTNVAGMVFKQYLDHKNILVLFDGYDEVPEKYRNKAASMIKNLCNLRYSICVTTRTIIKYELERLLDAFAVDINPFTKKEQILFLKDYFTKQVDNPFINNGKVLTFVHKLLTTAHQNLSDKDEEYTGVPLQLSLLAQVFTEDCKAYLLSDNFINKHFNLQSLYQKFIEGKSIIFCKSSPNHPHMNMQYCCKKLRSLLALKLLFLEDDIHSLNIYEELIEMNRICPNLAHFIQKDGIVESICESNAKFVHRTFAEYIVAEWLSENIKNRYKKTVKHLIDKIFESNYTAVRYFFDQILAQYCPLHLAIINHQVEKATELITSNSALLHKSDKGNRSYLHLIASWGVQHPLVKDNAEISVHFQKIVNKDKAVQILKTVRSSTLNSTTRDSLLNYTPFDYAIVARTLYVADTLCSKLEDLNQQLFSNNININYDIKPHLKTFSYGSLESVLIMHGIVQQLNMRNKKYIKDNTLENIPLNENIIHLKEGNGRTPLHWATINGELDTVSRLLSNGADANALDDADLSGLHYALIVTVSDQYEIIAELLKNGARVGLQDANGKTPLHYAVHYNQVRNLKLLLTGITEETKKELVEEGKCFNSSLEILSKIDSRGCTVMHWASEKGNINIMQLLLDHGANVDVKDKQDLTPLHWAAANGHMDTIKFLLSKEADPQIKDGQLGRTPLILAAQNGYSDVIELLLTHGVDINAVDIRGWNPLHWASKSGYSDTVQLLISRGANVQALDDSGLNPLHWASRQGHATVVDKLLRPEINEEEKAHYINTKDNNGLTALHWATQNKHLDIIVLLKNNRADIEAIDNEGNTALHWAVISDHKATVELILSMGTNVETKDNENRTALHIASQMGNKDIVEMLLSKGADLEPKDKTYGRTAIILAAMGGHTSTVQLLLSKHASVIVSDNDGLTPLHWAAINGHSETVKLLLANGAKNNVKDFSNLTAMDWAKEYGHETIVAILKEYKIR